MKMIYVIGCLAAVNVMSFAALFTFFIKLGDDMSQLEIGLQDYSKKQATIFKFQRENLFKLEKGTAVLKKKQNAEYQKLELFFRKKSKNMGEALTKFRAMLDLFKDITYLKRGSFYRNKGWVSPMNGFEYTLTEGAYGFARGQTECKKYGGNIASYGMQDIRVRRILTPRLISYGLTVRVGITNAHQDGQWRWVPLDFFGDDIKYGALTIPPLSIWRNGFPTGANLRCGALDQYSLLVDFTCDVEYRVVCERRLNYTIPNFKVDPNIFKNKTGAS